MFKVCLLHPRRLLTIHKSGCLPRNTALHNGGCFDMVYEQYLLLPILPAQNAKQGHSRSYFEDSLFLFGYNYRYPDLMDQAAPGKQQQA